MKYGMRSRVLVGVLAAVVALGVVAVGPAHADSKNRDKWNEEFTKKNGWSVAYGKRKGAWVAERDGWGGFAIPRHRSSKRVSLSVEPVDQESRELVQSYVLDFAGFDPQGAVTIDFFEPSRAIPIQRFSNISSGQVLDVNVDLGDGTPCSSFYVIVQDRKRNWAIRYLSVLHSGAVASPGASG